MKYKNLFFVVLLACSFPFYTRAQGVIKGFEFGEIINISQAYSHVSSLSFDMQINYADSARQDSIVEQIPASYKIQNGMYWAMLDSTEMIQANGYNVSVLHMDSVIIISNPQSPSNMMQLPIMDSLFRAQNVDSMNVTQINDSTRSLRLYFNPGSRYSAYIFNYDLNTYLLYSITYFIKTPAYDDGSGSGVSMVQVLFSNYSTQPVDNSYFQQNKFIYNQGGKFITVPPYTNFQLMVNVSK